MVEIREKEIGKKVFTKKDIQNFWNVINLQNESSKSNTKRTSFNTQIRCSDGTRYESEIDELFSEGSIFDLKRITSINIGYMVYGEDKKIEIDLTQGSGRWGNLLTVRGGDKNWVAGTFSQFENLLNSVKPQTHWFVSWSLPLSVIGGIVFALTVLKLTIFFFGSGLSTVDNILIFLAFIIPSLFLSVSIIDWVKKLWPNIEFDFGPEHEKNEKNRRLRLGSFMTIVILPLLFLIVPYFIK